MPKKRSNLQGSIRKRKDGTWEARYTIGVDLNGKQLQRSVYGSTRTEVSIKLSSALEKINTGKYINECDMLFKDYIEEWLSLKRNKIKSTTYDSYDQNIRIHLIPLLGNKRLRDIKRKHIQELYDRKSESGKVNKCGGLSSATLQKIHNILHSAFGAAVNSQLIAHNPTKGACIPRSENKERRVFTLAEQKVFILALEGERLQLAFLLQLSTGMRLGEVLALTWNDINLDEGYLMVRKTLSRIKNRHGDKNEKYKLIPQEPKTEKSKRLIPIPQSLIPLFQAHKAVQELEKAESFDLYTDNNTVFCTDTGNYIHPRNYMRSFYRIVEKAGLPKANVHSLRHTFATRMLELGENPRVVQEIIGHKNITLTMNTYTHVLNNTKIDAIGKIDNLMKAIAPMQIERKTE